ncbi:MAG: hypothetical protein AUK44_01955 [Porphyromonadaceae bacterium CG2_30_38_12]|nr:MAG: hypothetical protein AUK44_01955 [Porphyromonadaceae bacterium CG2_30_38_12]
MFQDILVYSIVISAIAYTILKIIQSLSSKQKTGCGGCSGCDIKQELLKKGEKSSHDCSCQSV